MKFFDWIMQLTTNRIKLSKEPFNEVSYYDAKYFHNDLDDERKYYLEVKKHGDQEPRFVKRSSIDRRLASFNRR